MSSCEAPPPGLDTKLAKLFSKGDDNWRELQPLKLFTNAFVRDDEAGRLLLGMKKRGFGKGMYNGFGGKVDSGETPLQAARRELQEEAGIDANLKECGILVFVNAATEYTHYVHMYSANGFTGEPSETDEMRPLWFAIPEEYLSGKEKPQQSAAPEIPYSQMWPDDELWMPFLLKGEYFCGRVDFGRVDTADQKGSWVMERYWFGKPL